MALQIQVLHASNGREIGAAFAAFERERPDVLLVSGGPLFTARRVQLTTLATRYMIPSRQPSNYRNRRTDELRSQYYRCVSSGWRLCRPHPQGGEASRLAGGAVDQIRAGHQRRDRLYPR